MAETKDKGPDNNKRLAELEEGVSALAMAMANAGLEVGESEDPLVAAGIEIARLTKAESDLKEQLEDEREEGRAKAWGEALALVQAVPAMPIAFICHEANRAYCASLGDDSQLPWAEAPEWQRASAIAGVEFHLANPDAGDAASHENWMKDKLADGWTYGKVKDAEKKTHPCLVEFDKLPAEQQFKDRLFRTVVHAAAQAIVLSGQEIAGNADQADTIAALEEQVRSLTEDLEAAQSRIRRTEIGAQKQLRKAGKSSAPRKIGAMKDADRAALIAAMEGGKEIEIVLSNGSHEIVEFDPILTYPAAFQRKGTDRFDLREALLVRGAGSEVRVRGVALLAGGKQVAYTEFPRPVSVPPGQEVKFDRMIGF